jgi:hypothetical protein
MFCDIHIWQIPDDTFSNAVLLFVFYKLREISPAGSLFKVPTAGRTELRYLIACRAVNA